LEVFQNVSAPTIKKNKKKKKTEEEEEGASFLHGMRTIIISTWQLQNVYGHRGGPHSSSSQSSGGREGRGRNIFSHMRHLSSHLCVQLCGWIYFIAS